MQWEVDRAADEITEALDARYITDQERQARVRAAQGKAQEAIAAYQHGVKLNADILDSTLIAAAQSDFVLPDAPTQQLAREDIRMRIAGVKGSILGALYALAQESPTYAAVLFHNKFGESLIRANGGDEQTVRDFRDNIVIAAVPNTPKAATARKLRDSFGKVQAFAKVTVPRAAQARIERASQPRSTEFQPDTIRPRR